jgi:hypothetical protein
MILDGGTGKEEMMTTPPKKLMKTLPMKLAMTVIPFSNPKRKEPLTRCHHLLCCRVGCGNWNGNINVLPAQVHLMGRKGCLKESQVSHCTWWFIIAHMSSHLLASIPDELLIFQGLHGRTGKTNSDCYFSQPGNVMGKVVCSNLFPGSLYQAVGASTGYQSSAYLAE